jgi:hypothetical protein
MKKLSLVSKIAVALALTAGALSVSTVQAASGCPRKDVYCLDVWNPVICSNGVVYSNSCYAYRACATGCVPYGEV